MHPDRKRIAILIACIVAAFGIFLLLQPVRAQVSLDLPTQFAGFSSQDLKVTIQNIVRIVLGFIGTIFLILMLYGGFIWMTSGGDEKKISKAKKLIVSAVVGLVITLSSYAIASFIIQSLTTANNNGGGGGPGGTTTYGIALGAGVLESHYPGRNGRNVARNTNIFITFKEAMDVNTMCPGAAPGAPTAVNIGGVSIRDANNAVPTDANDLNGDNILEGVLCQPTDPSNTTFKFDPPANLGLNNSDTLYRVTLTNQIQTAAGKVAFTFPYAWEFTVGIIIDTTPPTVLNVIPGLAQTVSRNSIVQINFSEPVDPSTASGQTSTAPPFDNITLDGGSGPIPGTYITGNQYQTTEFVSNDLCGQNSCGGNVYCLPAPATPPPSTLTVNGTVTIDVTDMAGNQLDQNALLAGSQPFLWNFKTDNTIDLKPPFMTRDVPANTSRVPKNNSIKANLTNPIEASFNKVLSATSITSQSAGLSRSGFNDLINYWVGKQDVDTNNDGIPDFTKVMIFHDQYRPLIQYHPGVDSKIKDLNQNCYYPAACDHNGDGQITVAGDDRDGDGDVDKADCALSPNF